MSEIGNMPSGESSLRVRVTFNDGTDGSVDRASAACAQSLHYQCEGGARQVRSTIEKGLRRSSCFSTRIVTRTTPQTACRAWSRVHANVAAPPGTEWRVHGLRCSSCLKLDTKSRELDRADQHVLDREALTLPQPASDESAVSIP